MNAEVKDRVDKKIGAVAEEKYRLVFAELPPWHDLKIFDELAERGWNFVIESWAYQPPKPVDLSNVKDPLERIAKHTYQWLAGYFTDAVKEGEYMGYFAYPYLEYARDYQCDGSSSKFYQTPAPPPPHRYHLKSQRQPAVLCSIQAAFFTSFEFLIVFMAIFILKFIATSSFILELVFESLISFESSFL